MKIKTALKFLNKLQDLLPQNTFSALPIPIEKSSKTICSQKVRASLRELFKEKVTVL